MPNKRVLITPPFTLSYPKLMKPEPFMENGKPKGAPVYTAEFIFDADVMDQFMELNEETGDFVPVDLARVAAALAKEEFPDIDLRAAVAHGGFAWPIKNGDTIAAAKGEKAAHYAGKKVVHVKAKGDRENGKDYPPKLYYMDGKTRKMVDRTTEAGSAVVTQKFYAGAVCRAEITVLSGAAGQNKYVTCYVNSVRFIKDGTKLGGGSMMDRFEGIHGGAADHDPTQGSGLEDEEIPF